MKANTQRAGVYLRVTVHDNDFISPLKIVCDAVYEIFCGEDKWPDEDDFHEIKKYIKYMLFGIDGFTHLMRWKGTNVKRRCTDMNYLIPDMEFIAFSDMPEWDNYESVYIPMFPESDIIIR